MESIRKAQIGTMHDKGDIVAKKTKDAEGQTVIKIYQREKKPFLIQAFFRIHDLCSKNHTNITMSLQKSSFKTENEKNHFISEILSNVKQDQAPNIIADYFLTGNIGIYKNDFHDFLFEKNFSLPDLKFKNQIKGEILTKNNFMDQLDWLKFEGGAGLTSANIDFLTECYGSEEKYFTSKSGDTFSKLNNYILENSKSPTDELKNSLKFLENKIIYGPSQIPYSDVKAELENKLDVEACKALYKAGAKADWDDAKDGSIVDFMLKNIASESRSTETTNFLATIFDNLSIGRLLKGEEKLIPCIHKRMEQYFNKTTNPFYSQN